MSHASGKNYDPSAWAKQRQGRIKRASELRLKRLSESPDKNHTFKPQLIARNESASSKLPVGARAGGAAALPRGTYDLTMLATMEDAFLPRKTTPQMIHRETKDSLDRRIDMSTSSVQGGRRREGLDVEEGMFQRAPPSRNGMNRWDGERVDGCSAGGDALSSEVDRQPHVRGLLGEPRHRWLDRNSHSPGTKAMASLHLHETAGGGIHPKERLLADGYGRHVECGPEGEGECFERSLRGGEEEVMRGEGGGSKGNGRRVVRRPEWNSDTAGDVSLASIVTDNSPAAVERRVAARRRQSSDHAASIRNSDDVYCNGNGYNNDSGFNNKRGEEIKIPGYPRPSKGKELPLEGRSKRESYRCQVVPSSKIESSSRECAEIEEEQLQRNLSLLKKKRNSFGNRRTQSARNRPGEASGQADVPDESNHADRRYAGKSGTRQQDTSRSAQEVMSRRSSTHSTMPMMTEVSRRGDSSVTPVSAYEMRSRQPPRPSLPPAEDPESPYTAHRDFHNQDHRNRSLPIGAARIGAARRRPSARNDELDRRNASGTLDGRGGYPAVLPEDAYPRGSLELRECTVCRRKFNSDALERHARVCGTSVQPKRKVFNSSQMRIKGTELEKFSRHKSKGVNKGKHPAKATRKSFDDTPIGGSSGMGSGNTSKWRQQSSQFREAIRQARVVTKAHRDGKSLAALPPVVPSAPDPSLVPCPHCGRRFNQTAGERHMKHCQNIRAKPSTLKKGSGMLLGQAARQKSSKSVSKGQRW